MCGFTFQMGQSLRIFMLHVNAEPTAPIIERTQ